MPSLAIVTSCDERYAPLAKGLVLSLLAKGWPTADQHICLLDIGCEQSTLDWMRERGVVTVPFDAEQHVPFKTSHLPSHIAAMAFRPFMKKVFPGYEVYLWIDSDTWVQQKESICLYRALAARDSKGIAISPIIDVNYRLHYQSQAFRDQLTRVYRAIYGEPGVDLAQQPVLGAGVFAMHRESQVWQHWANQLRVVYRRNYDDLPDGLHLAEQTALNRVLYTVVTPHLVESIHNYHLCAGPSMWIEDKICTCTAVWRNGQLTQREIGVVHLCGMGAYAEKYVKARAFFDRGRYLSDAELESIAGLKRQPKS